VAKGTVSTMVTSDWCETTGQIRNKTGITYESAQSILRDLSMWLQHNTTQHNQEGVNELSV